MSADPIRENNLSSSEVDPYYNETEDSWLDEEEGNLEEDPGSDYFGDRESNISRDDIRKLFQGVDAKNLPNEKDLLNTLRQALREVDSSDETKKAHGAELFYQVQEATQTPETSLDPETNSDGSLGSGESPSTSEEKSEEWDTPTSVEKGVNYFKSKSGEDFPLHPQGKGAQNVVETSGNVTISPLDPKTPVEITDDGYNLLITVKGEKPDTYKIKLSQVTQIQIDSENVTGSFKNEDGKVTVGSKGKKYVSQEMMSETASKLLNGVALIEGRWEEGFNWGFDGQMEFKGASEGHKYSADTKGKNKDVENVLTKMSQVFSESDEGKKAQLWEEISTDLSRWRSQEDGERMGHVNDRGQLLCDVLYGELGEDGLKKLLQDGLIPTQVVNNIIDILQAKPEENTSQKDADRIAGGHGWTHLTYAEFLKKYSSPSSSSGI